ncbi:MAG: pyridoxamine 5'-phosphate oxidase family protein [Caulobacteraceae bacterium]|nr:pyridoxamine 5'-phosphate oxidase family protein [Caulobacteraceae bacterium]
MSRLSELPEKVVELIRSATVLEFATLSAAQTPIDTPVLYFPTEDLSSIDLATGLAYPAKAERARRNPKVGLLIEGRGPGAPTVSIAGMAAVRDADIQANALRYIAETASGGAVIVPWSVARQAVWYWSRIIVAVKPVRVMWWTDQSQMDRPPEVWRAPDGTSFPASDPSPPGKVSAGPEWPQPPWPELAATAMASGMPAHLTLVDDEGFPLPFRVEDIARTEEGFAFRAPSGAPWKRGGKATLSFEGRATFVGVASGEGRTMKLAVERTLPILPMVVDLQELWTPGEDTRARLMGRLKQELERRGQPIPEIPQEMPAPTAGAQRRTAYRAAQAGNPAG